jgi:SAM-dependent MidA family methyltransferase
MSLTETIIQKIRREGPVSFHDFMEMALYCPGTGYYMDGNDCIGKRGDYYTSAFLTPLAGEMIGKQLEEMWLQSGAETFTIVEYGAGTGLLCHDILNRLKNNKALYNNLQYCIIEKSPAMRDKEKKILHEKVNWVDSIREIPGITGCILSNEVVDNFSVHRVVMEEELMEVFVDYDNGFVELLKPASPALKEYFEQLQVFLPKGFRTEINLEARAWLNDIARALEKGFVLTIDYGYPASELYCNRRSHGTLACYYQHSFNNSPYNNIGKQDITAHVNFSALHNWGLQYGLKYCGFISQAYFMLSLGLTAHLRKEEVSRKYDHATQQDQAFLLQTLLLDMGNKFKVLIQSKGINEPKLSGLQLSRPVI